jgi:hypothetical protein
MFILIRVRFMVLSTIFNNISVILRRSVLLVEEIGVPGGNNQPAESQKVFWLCSFLSHVGYKKKNVPFFS